MGCACHHGVVVVMMSIHRMTPTTATRNTTTATIAIIAIAITVITITSITITITITIAVITIITITTTTSELHQQLSCRACGGRDGGGGSIHPIGCNIYSVMMMMMIAAGWQSDGIVIITEKEQCCCCSKTDANQYESNCNCVCVWTTTRIRLSSWLCSFSLDVIFVVGWLSVHPSSTNLVLTPSNPYTLLLYSTNVAVD
jgi:hypothetical protein